MGRYAAVVIGVSAGGLNALSSLLPLLPRNFQLPVIIVQHRLNVRDEILANLLNHVSNLVVMEAMAHEEIVPGKIYLAPAGYHLLIEATHEFSLSVDLPVNYSIPSIDVLFESAAEVYNESLIGIVLTGANSDGSQGLKKIRELGGLGIVQNPSTAYMAAMPESAIRLAGSDHIMSLQEIGLFLAEVSNEQ